MTETDDRRDGRGDVDWDDMVGQVGALLVRHIAVLEPENPSSPMTPTGKWAEGARAFSAITQSISRLKAVQSQCRTQDHNDQEDAGAADAETLRAQIEGRFDRLADLQRRQKEASE